MTQQVGGVIGEDTILKIGQLGTGGVAGTWTKTCLHPTRVGVAMEEGISMIGGGEVSRVLGYSLVIDLCPHRSDDRYHDRGGRGPPPGRSRGFGQGWSDRDRYLCVRVCVCVCVCVIEKDGFIVFAVHVCRDGGYDNRRGGDSYDRRDEYYGSRYNRDDRYYTCDVYVYHHSLSALHPLIFHAWCLVCLALGLLFMEGSLFT